MTDLAPPSSRPRIDAEFVPWTEELRPSFLDQWKNGQGEAEHVLLVGRTGRGKTALGLDMVIGRLQTIPKSRAVILANKPKDPTLQRLIDSGRANRIRRWKDIKYEDRVKRLVVVWPKYGMASTTAAKNKPAFLETLDGILKEGSWTLFVDDVWYWVQKLRLGEVLDEYWNAARSSDVSVVAGSTRPVWITRSATSQHSWVCSFHIGDLEDRMRMGEVMGDRVNVPRIIDNLNDHDFVIRQTNTGTMYVSNLRS